MIKMKYILSTIILGILLVGCAHDPLIDYQEDVPEGMARLSVHLQTPSGSVVTTRTTTPSVSEQALTGNVVVMVLDNNNPATAKLKQQPVTGTVNTGNQTLTALLKEEATESYLCIVANIPDAHKTYLLGLAADVPLSDITKRLDLTVTDAGLSSPFPMSGWSEKITTISKRAPQTISVSLLRSVGRIDVDGSMAQFTVHGVQLINGAQKGYVLPQETLPYFGETDVIGYKMSSLDVPATTFTEKLYCFENAGTRGNVSNPTRVVIKGQRQGASSPSFYTIEIVYKETGGSKDVYSIERNKIYTIRLNKVDKDGYATYEEAAKSEAFNNRIESDIIVTDPYAYNIVTNGKQYMGITNSEFVLYPINQTTVASDLLVATLSYTCDPGWSEGIITAPLGITLVTGKLEVQHGSTALYRDIIVKSIEPGFTEGVIVAHIGNLRQEIKVTVKTPTLATGQIINDYFTAPNDAKDYKVGEIIAPSPETAWLKVSASDVDTGESALNDKITHPEGGIYIHVQPNIGFDASAKPREASLFVAGNKENQRVRVYVQQNNFDVYSGKLQITPYTYVGTFHRWNQTAERLIRINAKSALPESSVWWQATVVAGREFIVLSTEVSNDKGINCVNNPYGINDNAHYTTDEAIEANCQVSSTLRTVRGTSADIYFKVGLTGRLNGPAATPRYGLIALTYGTGSTTKGTHNIYVRQGEATDYLMRPWDPSTTPIDPNTGAESRPNEFVSNTRSKAAKICVYNLTNPDLSVTNDVIDMGERGYNFVQYPSQGGYYFLASGTQAINPTIGRRLYAEISPPDFYNPECPWQSTWETCPKGYRRPYDGEGRATTGTYADDIINSEIRQSLWLFPLHGVERSDFSNQIQGFLADGYFDRREIENITMSPPPDMTKGIVAKSTTQAAYWGFLLFNPHNYASVFIPLCGSYREETNDGASRQGRDGSFHTRTPGGGTNNGWIVAYGYFQKFEYQSYVFDMYTKSSSRIGNSIRCVKDEQPPVETDKPQVEKPTEGGNSNAISLLYTASGGTLASQFAARYTAEQIKKTNTITISVQPNVTLTDADYTYLNNWANQTTDHQLHHLIVRSANDMSIPAGAFTSAQWQTISLADAYEIAAGAFASSLNLSALSLGYLNTIAAASGAFAFDTSKTQLLLSETEYNLRNGNEWKSCVWKEISQY